GIVRSHLLGGLAQKRKMLVSGPLAADTDERTVKRASEAISLFLSHLKNANPVRWDKGRQGGLCVNVGIRALLLLLYSLILHAEKKHRNFDPNNAAPAEIVEQAVGFAKPLIDYLSSVSDEAFSDLFSGKYGSGG